MSHHRPFLSGTFRRSRLFFGTFSVLNRGKLLAFRIERPPSGTAKKLTLQSVSFDKKRQKPAPKRGQTGSRSLPPSPGAGKNNLVYRILTIMAPICIQLQSISVTKLDDICTLLTTSKKGFYQHHTRGPIRLPILTSFWAVDGVLPQGEDYAASMLMLYDDDDDDDDE